MIDLINEINAIHRDVRRQGQGDSESVTVVVRRSYPAPAEDVWDAITTPERIKRWFAPVTGDLREGGSFQVEGNASGDILKCGKPHLLKMTYGGETSVVEVRLTETSAGETLLEIEHTVPISIAQSGAGALWVGPGWDGGLLALGQFLRGQSPEDPVAAELSQERQEFSAGSVRAWGEAVAASGTAAPEEIAGGVEVALKHFAPGV